MPWLLKLLSKKRRKWPSVFSPIAFFRTIGVSDQYIPTRDEWEALWELAQLERANSPTTTTSTSAVHGGGDYHYPLDMTVLNDLDRFHLVMDTIDRVPQTGERGIYLKKQLRDKLIEHKRYIDLHGEDLPEIRNWIWGAKRAG